MSYQVSEIVSQKKDTGGAEMLTGIVLMSSPLSRKKG